MQYDIVFDYQDKIYYNQNPLTFLIKEEIYQTLRKSFFLLNETEKFIITEVILKEKSIINTALLLNVREKDVKDELKLSLELIYQLFRNMYYQENEYE